MRESASKPSVIFWKNEARCFTKVKRGCFDQMARSRRSSYAASACVSVRTGLLPAMEWLPTAALSKKSTAS